MIEKKTAIYYRSANVAELTKPLIEKGIDFKIIKTGYSCHISTAFEKIFISASRGSRKLFAAANKLSAEIDKAPEIDTINKTNISYYDFSERYGSGIHSFRKAYCVDIKSAYLSCLRVNKIISEKLHSDLSRLKKTDRLKSVGMLATQKLTFIYEKGKLIDYYVGNPDPKQFEIERRRRNYFMLVCYEIGRLMKDVEAAVGPDFLFFWTDGMYFKSIKAANIAKEIISNNGYDYSFESLTDFWIHNAERHAYITFQKDSKKKVFRVSKRNCTFETDSSMRDLIKSAENQIKFNNLKK